jgi:ribosomal protein S20
MKTYIEQYALTNTQNRNRNRKRHSRLKTILTRIATTLAIGAATYYASLYVG